MTDMLLHAEALGAAAAGAPNNISIPSPFVVGNSYNHGSNAYDNADMRSMSSGVSSYSSSFLPNADLAPSMSPSGLAAPVRGSPQLTQQDPIPYYFERVRSLQFVFAGNALTETLYYVRASIGRVRLRSSLTEARAISDCDE